MNDNNFSPVNVNSEIAVRYDKSVKTSVIDTKVFKREENKECEIGLIKKRKFVFECGGQNPSKIHEILDNAVKIKNLKQLLKTNHITQEQYDKKVNQLLDEY